MMATTALSSSAANPWIPRSARLLSIKQEILDTATYELAFENSSAGDRYEFGPGQFNMLYLPGFGESALSISSDPQQTDSISHTVRVAGNVTQALTRHAVGDQILLRGPFGSSWPMQQLVGGDVVIACGGIGLAPLRPAIYHIMHHREEYGQVHLLYGARTPQGLLYTDEYDRWRGAGIEVEVTVDSGAADWRGHIGVVPMLFDCLRLAPDRTRVLTCGPEIMMRYVAFESLSRRVPAQHIHLSMERNMQCAVGFCGHCQLGPAFVCKDGPVFTYEEIEPYYNVEGL